MLIDNTIDKQPVEAYPYVTKEANNMIEDFMLLANNRVAVKIARVLPKCSMLRNHPPPVFIVFVSFERKSYFFEKLMFISMLW